MEFRVFVLSSFLLFLVPLQDELKKKEEEEQKRQENEIAFRSWLMRKREQLLDERRVQKAQEMERLNFRVCSPGGAV